MLTDSSGSVMRTFAPRCFPTRRDEGADVCGTLSSSLVRSRGCQCIAARWAWVGSRSPLRMHDAGAVVVYQGLFSRPTLLLRIPPYTGWRVARGLYAVVLQINGSWDPLLRHRDRYDVAGLAHSLSPGSETVKYGRNLC